MLKDRNTTKTLQFLSMCICILSLGASLGGLMIDGLYNDPETIKLAWFANDIVTIPFAIALPIMLIIGGGGNDRPFLIWMGLMLYMCYNYAFYLFGAQFNEFFLIYVALFSLSLYSIFISLMSIDIEIVQKPERFRGRQLLIGAYLFVIAIPLIIVEVGQCLKYIISGVAPEVPTLIFALDLSTVVPISILGAILLWKNNQWGNVLAMMMLIKSFSYGLVLVLGTLIISDFSISDSDPLLPFYAFLVVGGFALGWMHLRDLGRLESNSKEHMNHRISYLNTNQ